jgi:hypothetical protein
VPVTVPVASRVISQPRVGASHALVPSQQASPALPHERQVPSAGLQTPSSRHEKPAQHTPPGKPQSGVVGSTSSGSWHTPLVPQTRPAQQSDDAVHAVVRGAQQRVPSQARPLQQSDAALQTALEPGWMQQRSPRPQRSPSSQIRPVQQVPPADPQGPVGTTLPSGRVTVPSIVPPSRGVLGLLAHPVIAIPNAKTDAASQARSMAAMVAGPAV